MSVEQSPNTTFEQEKQSILDDVQFLTDQVQTEQDNSHDLHDKYTQQNNNFLSSADNDDGNEDHQSTYDADGDNVRGADRGEELVQIEEFQESTENTLNQLENIANSAESCTTPEALVELRDQLSGIEDNHKDVSGYSWHNELGPNDSDDEN